MSGLTTIRLLLLSSVLLFAGCASFEELHGRDYPTSALLNYNEGLKYLDDENYEIAQKYFQLVKTKYAFSKYAAMAELRQADTIFRRDLYSEAVDSFKSFQRNHPNHACVAYAQYRIGEAYFEQITEDWWFMPPAYERDQKLTEKALKEHRRLVQLEKAKGYYFPPGFEPEKIEVCEDRDYLQQRSMIYLARERIDFNISRLVNREVFVAEFYLKNDKPVGAVVRMEGMFSDYPEAMADLELVLILARAYTEAHMYKRARATWRWIARNHPRSPEAREIGEALEDIDEAERRWILDRREEEAKTAKKREESEKVRIELGLQKLDPDPDPNADDKIPLVDLEEPFTYHD